MKLDDVWLIVIAIITAAVLLFIFSCAEEPVVDRCTLVNKARIDCEIKEAALFREFKAKPLPQRIKHTCEELYPGECR